MIQRACARQARQLLRRSRHVPSPSATRQHFPPFRIQPLQSRLIASRKYSTAQATEAGSHMAEPPPQTSGGEAREAAKEEDPGKKELEAKNREIIDLKDKYLRSVAEFRNLQDRTKRDIDQARQFAISRFAGDLIESVDNFDRALGTVDPASLPSSSDSAAAESSSGDNSSGDGKKELNGLYQGLKMTESILMQTLKKHGLERFDPSENAEKFDPNIHEAAFMTKMEDKEDGTVFSTMQKGFLLNGRVVRAAKVGVVKNT